MREQVTSLSYQYIGRTSTRTSYLGGAVCDSLLGTLTEAWFDNYMDDHSLARANMPPVCVLGQLSCQAGRREMINFALVYAATEVYK